MTSDSNALTSQRTSERTKILMAGGIIGALTGIGAAYLLLQKTEDESLRLSAGEGLKLGITVLRFLRQVTQLGD